MGLAQLVGSRQTVLGIDGKPLQNGKLFVRELNSATPITTYKESALVNPNTQPVRTDGAGKCRIWVSRDCDFRIETKDNVLVDEELSINPEDLSDPAGSGLVPNGSFEVDTDANDEPDGWARTNESGSSNGLDDTKSTAGAQSMRFTSAGSGGGDIITDDFFPVVETDDLRVDVDIECSVVDVRVIVRIEWFDISKVSISNSDVYDNATSNPLTFTTQNLVQTPPANSRFAKLRLIGCDPSDSTPGSTWFDNCKVFYPLVVTGVFDNITIQDNEIISTNLNGDIELTPNGTGDVVIAADIVVTGTVDGRDIDADGTILDGIEPGADITDTGNVTTAGALMDSEVDADIKTLTLVPNVDITTYGASLVDDADAAAAIATLGLDADVATLSLPASTTISAFGRTLIDDAAAVNGRATLDAQQLISALGEMTVTPVGTDDFFYQDGSTAKKINWNQFQMPTTDDTNNHTFGSADVSEMRVYTGSGGHTWTMDSGVGQGKCYIGVINAGSGNLTLASGTAALATAGAGLVVPPDAIAILCRVSSTVWKVGGTGLIA